MTRAFIVILSASIFFLSCNNAGKAPNVSGIKIDITTTRFEKNLFDTTSNSLCNYLKQLQSSSPAFTTNFLHTILNTDPQWSTDSTAAYVNSFVKAYRTVYDSSENIFNNFSKYENEIKNGLQFVKYYFPNYQLPKKIITYIGPVDGYGDILSEEGLLVGLQQHLGKNYSLYQSEMVQQFYPEYISSRFEPDYIAINCMKNIADDIYPEKEFDKPLINQMIENGKRLYLLQQFLPGTDAYKLIGYRKEQFKDCNDHEAVIWNLFVKNSLLQKALEQAADSRLTGLIPALKGATALMFTEVGNAPAKLIKEFRKKNDKPLLKAAFVEENIYIGDGELDALANIKSKNELIAEVLGLLQSPAKRVIGALQANAEKKDAA